MKHLFQFKTADKQIGNPLIEGLKSYYVNHMYNIIKKSKRNALYSILMFCIYQLILVQLCIDNSTYEDLTENKLIFSEFISYFFFMKDFSNNTEEENNLTTAVQIFLLINCFIVLFFLVSLIFKSRIKRISFEFMSLLLQSYEYLIALPSIYISLCNYQYILSIINIALTVLIGNSFINQLCFHLSLFVQLGSVIISLDYDYKFCDSDILQKCDSHLNPTLFHLDLVMCISSSFFDIYMMIGSSFVINLLKLLIILRKHCYLNEDICKWSIIFCLFRISLIFPMIVYCTRDQQKDLLFLTCLIVFPISYKLGKDIFVSWYNFICLENIQTRNSIQNFTIFRYIVDDDNQKTDIFCRRLFKSIQEKTKFTSPVENSAFVFASHEILQYQSQGESSETSEGIGTLSASLKNVIFLKFNQKK